MVTRAATDATTFANAVTASSSGDTITCAAGNYGVYSSSRQFTGVLTVKSADYRNPAVFSEISLTNAWGWTFEDLVFNMPYTAGVGDGSSTFNCTSGKRITVTRCEAKHNNNPSGVQFGRCMGFFYTDDVTVQHCKVSTAKDGIVFSGCNRVTALSNEVTDMRADAIDTYGNQTVLLENNFLHKWRASWAYDDHSDAMQLAMPSITDMVPTNNTFRNNIIDIDGGSWIQNIFTRSEAYDSTANNAYRLVGTVIEGNWIKGSFTYGIALGANAGGIVRNNNLIWTLMDTAEPYNAASIIAPAPNNHQGPYSAQAVPIMYIASTTGSGILTGNRWWGASYYSGSRLNLTTSEAAMIALGWTISDNVIDNTSAGPARPAFITDFGTGTPGGGGSPVIPTVTGSGAGGRNVNFSKV